MSRPFPHIPEQFAKLAALAERSTFPAEQETARRKAEALLAPEVGGYDRALRILAYQAVMAKAPGNFLAGFDEFHEIDHPGHMAEMAAARAEKRRKHDARRAELVAEFGSLEAVLAPCWREQALHVAVAPWREAQLSPHQRWTHRLAGLTHDEEDKAPPELIAAIEGAFPMPTTYAEAVAEVAYWDQRNDDMELAARPDFRGDDMLDTPCAWRYRLVRSLVEHRMPLHTAAEIAARMRLYRWNETGTDEKVEDALLRDLDALAAREAASPSPPVASSVPPSVASTRPAMDGSICDLLMADPTRSDRSIAREVGCSPTTVGTARRGLNLSSVQRSVQRGGQRYEMRGRSARQTTAESMPS